MAIGDRPTTKTRATARRGHACRKSQTATATPISREGKADYNRFDERDQVKAAHAPFSGETNYAGTASRSIPS